MTQGAVGGVARIGLIAGTLDITENIVFNAFRHITPAMIFRYIASGLTGPWALHAGAESIALGVAMHYTIAMFWTATYWMLAGLIAVLVRRPVVCGLLYGAVVYTIMNFVVLPLTRVPHSHAAASLASRISGVLALLFCIGLTVAVLTARAKQRSADRV
jgi:hypothetical protein